MRSPPRSERERWPRWRCSRSCRSRSAGSWRDRPGGWTELSTGTLDGRAVLTVRNSGPVIPPGEVARLFLPFQRMEAERTARSDGHGLGLAIARAVADAHLAPVTARARADGGLDVTVAFPLAARRGGLRP
ncbi:MAG TPA: ATP-binding protein [Trebonia sp.]